MSNPNPHSQKELEIKQQRLLHVFQHEITDSNIRHFVFGQKVSDDEKLKNILLDTKQFPRYFKNMMILAFYYVYACYRYDVDDMNRIMGKVNTARTSEAERFRVEMQKTLSTSDINMGLIAFVLTEVQLELDHGEQSHLAAMLGGLGSFDKKFKFGNIFEVIYSYDNDPLRFEGGQLEMTTMMLDIVQRLTMLKTYCLLQKEKHHFLFVRKDCVPCLEYDEDYEGEPFDILSLEHLFIFKNRSFYRLFSVEKGEKSEGNQPILRLCYHNTRGGNSLTFTLPQDDGAEPHHLADQDPDDFYTYLLKEAFNPHQALHAVPSDAMNIGQVHTIRYKSLRHLALAIADVLYAHDYAKQELCRRLASRHPNIIKQNHADNAMDADIQYTIPGGDSAIMMLLVEAGPSVVLEAIIGADKANDKQPLLCALGGNLYRRVSGAAGLARFADAPMEIVAAVQKIVRSKLILGEGNAFGKVPTEALYNERFPYVAARWLMSLLRNPDQEQNTPATEDNLFYTGNLFHNISFLKKERENSTNPEKLLRESCIVLGETLKHLMCFYEGVVGYGQKKSAFDNTFRHCSPNDKDIKEWQISLSKAFFDHAQDKAKELSANPTADTAAALALLQEFIDFCTECSPAGSASRSANLSTALGRFEILDTGRFTRLVRQLTPVEDTITGESADRWVEVVLNILKFFKTGSTPDMRMEGELLGAIYPYTAVFTRDRENLDGYQTITFSLDTHRDVTKGYEINVLTEFTYRHREVFYCLPHVNRANTKWWVDPLLVDFRNFNDSLRNIWEENK